MDIQSSLEQQENPVGSYKMRTVQSKVHSSFMIKSGLKLRIENLRQCLDQQ